MTQHKILFTGPSKIDKAAAIRAISVNSVVTKNIDLPNASEPVALAHGLLQIGMETIHLYATPADGNYSKIQDWMLDGGLGLIVLLDNGQSDPFSELRFFQTEFHSLIRHSSMIVGISNMTAFPSPTPDDYYLQLAQGEARPPMFEVDLESKADISLLLQSLLYTLDPGLEEDSGESTAPL